MTQLFSVRQKYRHALVMSTLKCNILINIDDPDDNRPVPTQKPEFGEEPVAERTVRPGIDREIHAGLTSAGRRVLVQPPQDHRLPAVVCRQTPA